MLIISDTEAIQHILTGLNLQGQNRHPRFACYLGAGASVEAGVKMASQICNDIYNELLTTRVLAVDSEEQIQALNKLLKWKDQSLRYVTCIKERYPDPSLRVDYFRNLLRSIGPSFAHHAIALLMKHRYFKNTCLTTNFDKLLESAFIQQGDSECQPIRNAEESKFWLQEEDRHYVIKLHGDYDTHNVLNTSEETASISEQLETDVSTLLDAAGLVVIGTAGYEKSVHTLFDQLSKKAGKTLRSGLLWGVYVGPSKPEGLTKGDIEALVRQQLDRGEVSGDIMRMIEWTNPKERLFCFFPVWGAGNFLYDLIKATGNKALKGSADLYLDREMRLRQVFKDVGLADDAIKKHLSRLELKRTLFKGSLGSRQSPEQVYKATSKTTRSEIRILYGDITSRSFMAHQDFRQLRRAVVSPDDTFITAGGGVAEGFLVKAGQRYILNEVAKFSPINQGSVAVTSAGNLPVHHIFHAAAIKVETDASYSVSKQSVYDSMLATLQKASALEIGALWVPLMGTGVAGLPADESFGGILEAICKWESTNAGSMIIMVFIYKHTLLETHDVFQLMQAKLAQQFTIEKASA